jgi:hypothetical protein
MKGWSVTQALPERCPDEASEFASDGRHGDRRPLAPSLQSPEPAGEAQVCLADDVSHLGCLQGQEFALARRDPWMMSTAA